MWPNYCLLFDENSSKFGCFDVLAITALLTKKAVVISLYNI